LSPDHTTQELTNTARFWLSRGIAGLRLTPDAGGSVLAAAQLDERMRALRTLCASYAGQRLLLWDMPEPMPGATQTTTYRHHRAVHSAPAAEGAQMVIDRRLLSIARLSPGEVRQAVLPDAAHPVTSQSTPVPVSDAVNHPRSFDRLGDHTHDVQLAKLLATALLAGRGAPLLYFGQEIGMTSTPVLMQWDAPQASVAVEDTDADSLLNWYRRLSALRHANAALRTGSLDLLDATNSDVAAWVRRPQGAGTSTSSVLVVCNLSNRPQVMSLGTDLRRLGVETGSAMMHTLASSTLTVSDGAALGSVSVNHIELPPYGVYIGELTPQPGLESTPSPLRHRSGRASSSSP
jgi:alpha-glucosidase